MVCQKGRIITVQNISNNREIEDLKWDLGLRNVSPIAFSPNMKSALIVSQSPKNSTLFIRTSLER